MPSRFSVAHTVRTVLLDTGDIEKLVLAHHAVVVHVQMLEKVRSTVTLCQSYGEMRFNRMTCKAKLQYFRTMAKEVTPKRRKERAWIFMIACELVNDWDERFDLQKLCARDWNCYNKWYPFARDFWSETVFWPRKQFCFLRKTANIVAPFLLVFDEK